mmetsp:Transcript_34911/g.83032  ORF Transcript_34911/g.83032 Transcript_34911/m.83032 type:complete len:276 (+) Transcript_34911:132-959(+)
MSSSRISLFSRDGVQPWGIEDRRLEEQYLAYYWLTFANNNKIVLSVVMGIATLCWSISFVNHFLTTGMAWVTTGADLFQVILNAGICHCFSRKHLAHTFKNWVGLIYRFMMWIVPVLVVVRGCSDDCSRTGLLVETLLIATIGGWSCPHFTHHTLNLFAVNFIPLAWKIWHTDGWGAIDSRSRWTAIGERTQTSLVFFLGGTALNGMLCVERRFLWLEQIPSRANCSRSRSPSPSRSSSSSFSSADPKRTERLSSSSPEPPTRLWHSTSMPQVAE